MFKRLVALHLSVCLLFLGLLGRLAYIGTAEVYSASTASNSVFLMLNERRGAFYDCNGQSLTNTQNEYAAILRPTQKVLGALDQIFSKEEIPEILKRLQAGKPILQKVPANTKSTDEIPIIALSSRYDTPQLMAHLLGNGAKNAAERSGLEKSFYDFLTTDSFMKIRYHVDARGRMLEGDNGEIVTNNYNSKRGVQLTIDKRIQALCEEVADKAEKFKKGAIVVLDVKTSQIRAMVSRPNLDLNHLSENMEDENAPFINRSLTAYTVGSVFKPVVACTAIENGLEDFTYFCPGFIQLGSTVFNCHKLEGHGQMDLQNAIGQSCNPYFIALGQQIGGTLLLNKVTDFGFGQENRLAEGLYGVAGTLPTMKEVNENGNLANFSFGQGSLTATPLQIANMVACIANNGYYNTPTLVEKLIDDQGNTIEETKQSDPRQIVEQAVAKTEQNDMVQAVETGSGRSAKPAGGGAGGKTATAQTGWMKKTGEEVLHVWFAGFYPAENPEYAIAIMDEDGSSGATDCCPIFKEIVDGIAQNLT